MTVHVHDFTRRPFAPAYMLRAALPLRRPRDLAPPIVTRWSGHRADPRDLAALLRLTGLRAGPTLPLLYPHVFGFRLAMATLTHPAFPVPIWGVLQTRNRLVQHAAIAVDARLDLETRVAAGRAIDKGAEVDLHTTVRGGGALLWESVNTFRLRGRFGAPDPAPPLAAAPPVDAPVVATWTLRDEAHWEFGRLTGDYNGIHAWDWYARRMGFARALYHPPRVLGECLARLPLDDRWPRRLDVWLKGPVPHGARVELRAAGGTFALHVEEARPAIVGRLTCGGEP